MTIYGTRFLLTNRARFPLPGTDNRFFHIATIQAGLREYMYFVDSLTQKTYIEEITGGHLEAINDDNLWQDLANFIQEQGLTKVGRQNEK